MKRILFVIDALRIGGIQSSLINILRVLDYSKYEVSLIAFYVNKDFRDRLPPEVKIIDAPSILKLANMPSKEALQFGKVPFLFRKGLAVFAKVFSANTLYSLLFRLCPRNDIMYDTAISYTNNGNNNSVYFGCNKFVLERVNAQKKITWLHVDYHDLNMNTVRNNEEYRQFHEIVCVSHSVEKTFLNYLPDLKGKTKVIHNLLDIPYMQQKAKEDMATFPFEGFKIVTVARLDVNKNLAESLHIAKILKDRGYHYKWDILGDGPEWSSLHQLTQELGVEDCVVFRGYVDNPYPYVKNANLYVSTSLTESFGLSIYESISLGTPVIAKRYSAVDEVITDGENGIVVDGDADCVANEIAHIIDDKQFYSELVKGCSHIENKSSVILAQIEECL